MKRLIYPLLIFLLIMAGCSLIEFQEGLDETSAVVSDVQEVADAATDGEDLAISVGEMLAPLAGPYAPWLLALFGVWRAKKNRDTAKEIASSVNGAVDTSKIKPQSAGAKRVVDEAQGKTRISLPI